MPAKSFTSAEGRSDCRRESVGICPVAAVARSKQKLNVAIAVRHLPGRVTIFGIRGCAGGKVSGRFKEFLTSDIRSIVPHRRNEAMDANCLVGGLTRKTGNLPEEQLSSVGLSNRILYS